MAEHGINPTKLLRLGFFLPLLAVSCATGLGAQQGEHRFDEVRSFGAIADVVPSWNPLPASGGREEAGIAYLAGRTASPRLEFHAVRIDLADPSLRVLVSGGEDSLSMKVSTFVRENGLLVGINALPFEPSSGREGEERNNIGIIISERSLISLPHRDFDALVFFEDGRARIMAQREIASVRDVVHAAGGFRRILQDGEPVARVRGLEPKHPRSATGISPDGRFLYLLVIDGRRSASVGATEEETALLMKALGSGEALNLDGGGSSSLALRLADGRVRVMNTPVHSGIPGRERPVAGSLGIGRSGYAVR
ncbi:MAG: phosphodiester glycosidase family protein [Treponema sp.]|nr:phosphodiester glycosidase family protein [Treponema sp.]